MAKAMQAGWIWRFVPHVHAGDPVPGVGVFESRQACQVLGSGFRCHKCGRTFFQPNDKNLRVVEAQECL